MLYMLRFALFCCLSLLVIHCYSQQLATLEVDLSRPTGNLSIPIEVNLDSITSLPESSLELVRVVGKDKIFPVPFQVDHNQGRRTLYWMAEPSSLKKITYHLVRKRPGNTEQPSSRMQAVSPSSLMQAVADNGELTILDGKRHLLQYVYKTVYPPSGIDTAYKKSGFIHPLWSPHGQVLTRIQAPDHYHHYGIWDPWTHVLYKGDTVDFWNLKDRKGTVRFARFASRTSGPVFAGYEAEQDHVAFRKDGEETAIRELQSVRVYRPATGQDAYIFDLTIRLACATPAPVLLLAYRYGGVGWRATADWNKDNSEVLTSEGKTRKDADGSTARWCVVQGAVGGDYAGAEMISHPGNYNYPEPLRIWPENMNGRGDVYANFSPTKDKDWLLQPGHDYFLHYRWVVFNGHFGKEQAEGAWNYFATPPTVKITLTSK